MIGMVLAAGAGTRLGPETAELPKTLLAVDGDRTILDVALGNFRHVGLEQAVVVSGYAHDRLAERVPELERRHGLKVELVYNPKALEWNNAYSLWCAREAFSEGVLLANGDTVHPASVEETLLEARGPELVIAVDDSKPLAEEEMKVHVTADGYLDRINKALDPSTAHGEYIGVTLIEPAGRAAARRRARGHLAARPLALLRGRLPGVRRPRRARRHRADRRRRVGRGRRPPRPRACPGGRVPLLTRMVGTPLTIDIGPGAVAGLAPLLADRRISSGGHVAVIVGPGLGEELAATLRPQLANGEIWDVAGGSVQAGAELAARLRAGFYDAVVGIGGGRTIDVAKYAASLSGLPVGGGGHQPRPRRHRLAGRVARRRRRGPQGLVRRPDADRGGRRPRLRAPQRARHAPVGDRRRDQQPVGDRRLAAGRARARRGGRRRGRHLRARRGDLARAPRGRDRRRRVPDRARRGARALGPGDGHRRVEPPVQRRRPRDPARDRLLFPGTANHGELAGAASLFTSFLREDEGLAQGIDTCLRRHGLPRTPGDLGLTEDQFVEAVVRAPSTRPDRFTILEHLALDEAGVRRAVAGFLDAYDR